MDKVYRKKIINEAVYVDLSKKSSLKGNVNFSFDDVIAYLGNMRERNRNVVVPFNNVNLYSMLDNEETCYQKVYGKSKEVFMLGQKVCDKHCYEEGEKQ